MASKDYPKRVLLKGDAMSKEALANAAFTPGMLVERMTTGKFRKHATAGGVKPAPMFAREPEWAGGTIDTAYATDEQSAAWYCRPGCEVYALVAANAAAIVVGDLLESAGDGTLRKCVNYLTDSSGGTANTTIEAVTGSYVEATMENNTADLAAAVNRLAPGAVARAIEALDNSGGSDVARIRVEVL